MIFAHALIKPDGVARESYIHPDRILPLAVGKAAIPVMNM